MGQIVHEESMEVKKERQGSPPASSTSSVQSVASKSPSPQKKLKLDDFSWDKYLKETASISAPSEYFRQSKIPPVNEFRVGMKLEARDPRNIASVCVASVIATSGARLRLRLDGSDNKNDFWRLVDSSDIQPVGTCEKAGELLQPPLGFQLNVSTWPMFLLRTLSGSDLAPEMFFKKEPPKPPVNNFKVGMKIEAVDRKNPQMICPATIGAVRGDQVRITLDGWSGAFDYWCRYDSRDIFPVGWCFLTEDLFHPPGIIVEKKAKTRGILKSLKYEEGAQAPVPSAKITGKTQSSSYNVIPSSTKPPQKTVVVLPTLQAKKAGRTRSTGATSVPKKGGSVENIPQKRGGGKQGKKEKCIPVVSSTSSASLSSLMRRPRKDSVVGPSKIVMSTVCVYVNKYGDCGPYLDQKRIQQLPDHFGPGPVNVVLRRIVQACVDCAIDTKTVFGFIKPDNRGGEVITASFDGEFHAIQLPPVNSASFALRFLEIFCHKLHCDTLLSSQPFTSSKGNTQTPTDDKDKPVKEETTEKQSMKRSPQQLVPCFAPVSPKKPKMTMHASKVLSPAGHGMPKKETLPEDSKNLSVGDSLNPAHASVYQSISETAQSISSTEVDENTLSTQSSCEDSKFDLEQKTKAPSYIAVPDPSVLKQDFYKDPSTWSVEEVIQFMKHTDPQLSGPLADLFRQHEIDGKALLLLKSDTIMKYLGLKLGPTLKLCYYIEKLKEFKYN